MAQQNSDITITSQRGGMNDTDNPSALREDECVLALNTEWFYSTVGERRQGCEALDLTGSNLFATGQTAIVHLSQWFPTNDVTNPELWAVAAAPGNAGIVPSFARRAGTSTGAPAWTPVLPQYQLVSNVPDVYNTVTRSLNGKLFFAYTHIGGGLNGNDRLKVWDGSQLRVTGLHQANAPQPIVDEGVGTYSGNRFFRQRFTRQNAAGQTVLRSEPSVWNITTPSGTGKGVTITRGLALSESETHWEVEASIDGATFYRIATLPLATLTYTDETPFAVGYAAAGVLSDSIGAYLTQPSAKFLAVDGNRLLMAGNQTDLTKQSDVSWTPVVNDPGIGNDERLPLVTTGGDSLNMTVTLDNFAGGPITGITDAVYGVWYVFKYSRIYRATRTNDNTRAYDFTTLSTGRGALEGSIFPGVDENGQACIYFLDPLYGPSRLGPAGIQVIKGLRGTWKRVNLKATDVVSRGTFYPYKQQSHWWVAADGTNVPSLKLVLQVSEVRMDDSGSVRRGWSLADGKIAQATAVCTYWEWVTDAGSISLSLRPFIGLTSADGIQRCDVQATDGGQAYTATLVTKPYIAAGLLNRFGAMTGALLATAITGATALVRLIRDFGVETTNPAVSVSFTPVATETMVIKLMDNLRMSEAYTIQVKISDV